MLKVELVSLNELGEPLPDCSMVLAWRRRRRQSRKTISAKIASTTMPTTVNTPATAPFLSKNDDDFLLVSRVAVPADSVDCAGSASDDDVVSADGDADVCAGLLVTTRVSGEPVTVTTEIVTKRDDECVDDADEVVEEVTEEDDLVEDGVEETADDDDEETADDEVEETADEVEETTDDEVEEKAEEDEVADELYEVEKVELCRLSEVVDTGVDDHVDEVEVEVSDDDCSLVVCAEEEV